MLAADDAYVAAELARDETALRRLIDERFVFNQGDGTTLGREAFMKHGLGQSREASGRPECSRSA